MKHKVTLALVWSSPSSDVCDKRVIQLEMNWEKKKGPCKSGELCLSQCNHVPFLLALTSRRQDNPWCLMKSPPWQTSQVHSTSHSTEIDCCSLWLRTSVTSCCYIGILVSVSLPAGLFMGKEQVPLRHFNAPLTWPVAMSRLNLISTDTTTKNKGNQREQPLSISHPFHSSFPPCLHLSFHPFYSYYWRAQ